MPTKTRGLLPGALHSGSFDSPLPRLSVWNKPRGGPGYSALLSPLPLPRRFRGAARKGWPQARQRSVPGPGRTPGLRNRQGSGSEGRSREYPGPPRAKGPRKGNAFLPHRRAVEPTFPRRRQERLRLRKPTRRSDFFSWTVHGPFSFCQEQKENGGCIALPSSWLYSPLNGAAPSPGGWIAQPPSWLTPRPIGRPLRLEGDCPAANVAVIPRPDGAAPQ